MHLLSDSNTWVTESEFVNSTGVISKAMGESKIEILKDYISNKSFVVIDGKTIKNDYIINHLTENKLLFRSQNPELGVQTGTFDIDRNTIYSKFVVENTKLNGFEVITRNGKECFANGALDNDNKLINTWVTKMKVNIKDNITVRCANLCDISDWINLVKEVEPLFGKMIGEPEFDEGMKTAIQAGFVFCAVELVSNTVVGVVVINKNENVIEWLAVSDKLKGHGIGQMLVEKAIDELDCNRDVVVQTFSKDFSAGNPARKLYEKYGFIDHEKAGKNPAGIDTVLMVRKCATK